MLKPFSSRVKLVVEYIKEEARYIMSERDKGVLVDYMSIDEFNKTTKEIEN
jgi:hypothetical protein